MTRRRAPRRCRAWSAIADDAPTPRRWARTRSSSSASAPRSPPRVRSPSPGSWSGRSTSRGTATTAGRRRVRDAPATSSRPPSCTRSSAPRSARLLEQAWEAMGRPDPFTVTEAGAGTGALAAGLLGGLRDAGSPLLPAIRYRPVEMRGGPDRRAPGPPRAPTAGGSPRRRRRRRPARSRPARWSPTRSSTRCRSTASSAGPAASASCFVGVDGDGFAWVEAEPSTPALAARLEAEGVELADGQVTEVCLAVDDWLAGRDGPPGTRPGRARGLRRRAATPCTRRRARTARCGRSRATRVGGDPFRHVGRQDLTAHRRPRGRPGCRGRAGLDPLGETTQAELLGGLGRRPRLRMAAAGPARRSRTRSLLRSALARLLDPRGMGGFRVLVFGRGMPPDAALPGPPPHRSTSGLRARPPESARRATAPLLECESRRRSRGRWTRPVSSPSSAARLRTRPARHRGPRDRTLVRRRVRLRRRARSSS